MKKMEGLGSEEAERRLRKHGPNEIKEEKRESLLVKFLSQFKDFVVLVLLAAAVVATVLGEGLDAALIFLIVVLNGIIGFAQEYKAEKAIAALKQLVSPKAKVMRDGEVKVIPAREIVPGDIILLEVGDKVPADCELVENINLAVDESALTGESIRVRKKTHDMVYMGTLAVYGRGEAVVRKTGMDTEIGKIAAMVQKVKKVSTPLAKDLERLGKRLGLGAVVLCAVIFIIGALRGIVLFRMFLTAVALAVAAIPEGLPAVVTIALALGVQRMSKRNAITRKLKAVETLGCTTVICTDKTGTLTQNEMTVKEVYCNHAFTHVEGAGYEPKGRFVRDGKEVAVGPDMELLLRVGALCNTASLSQSREKWEVIGDPTEGSLLTLAGKGGIQDEELEKEYEEVMEFSFDSTRKRMSAVYEFKKKRMVYAKGALEGLLDISSRIREDGKVRRMTGKDRERIKKANDRFTSKGYRTLGMAYKEVGKKKLDVESVERDLVFIGFVGMMDVLRDEVKPALELCRSAGVRVMMVTGDHKLTAKAIASELGMKGDVLTGEQIDRLSNSELGDVVERVSVYARATPAHKLRIIRALHSKGHVVTMTGDGVNDAPALKKADIGIAMGMIGTDVAKESSDMVLADDNFATIVSAIEEGRVIFSNIKKSVMYLIAGNVAEIVVIFSAIIAGLQLPFLPAQLLWINLLTDGLPAVALSADPPSSRVMKMSPRKKGKGILTRELTEWMVFMGLLLSAVTLFFYLSEYGGGMEHAMSMAFAMLIMGEITIVFVMRTDGSAIKYGIFSNKYLIGAIILSLFLMLFVIYTPFAREVFFKCGDTCSAIALDALDWVKLVVASVVLFAVAEATKKVRGKKR